MMPASRGKAIKSQPFSTPMEQAEAIAGQIQYNLLGVGHLNVIIFYAGNGLNSSFYGYYWVWGQVTGIGGDVGGICGLRDPESRDC